MAKHNLMPIEGQETTLARGIRMVREAQANGHMADFAFVVPEKQMRAVYVGDAVPYLHQEYIVVPKDQPAFFNYGLDSRLHPDAGHYLAWVRQVLDDGDVSN